MNTRAFLPRIYWLGLGAAAAVMLAACASRPEPAPTPGTEPQLEEILVTGSRNSDRRRTRDGNRAGAASMSELQVAQPVVAGALPGFQALAGSAAAAPYAAPGEELWIITRPADAPDTRAPEDASPGSGALLANVPADATAPGAAAETIPLPLEHTDVRAAITGYVGTVDVTQQFANPFDEKIEAVYVFPLPEKAAVREFVMTIGERRIRGILREREEAEQIYRQARAQGYQASLLTQHRPNVFEQKVANIEPGKRIDVEIRYFHTLGFDDGWYSFVFPTVVGPRYNPPASADPVLALPRDEVRPTRGAAVRYLRPNERSGHDISISVDLDAGVAIEEVETSHDVVETRVDDSHARIELANRATLPNEDFELRFRVAGETVKSNLLTYVDPDSGEGYFTLMLYPPRELEQLTRQPLELVFVLDCSGSMQGQPLAQAKDAVLAALDRLGPDDTFQIIRFSTNASRFGREPVPATAANVRQARNYVRGLTGGGGTQMIEGIKAALDFPHDPERLRFVSFMTDGFIGNELEILGAVNERVGASRIFSFGVGSSVNRYLLERMAGIGRGAVAYLGLDDSGSEVMDFFFERISHPALIDVGVDWSRMSVSDVYPARLPDLFVGRPVVVTGRYSGEPGDVTVHGRAAGRDVRYALAHDAEADTAERDFIPSLWARLRIAELADRRAWAPNGAELALEIRQTALEYGLMSDYTSFVAVDASRVTEGDHGTTVFQAVPVPAGVRYETTVRE